MVSSLERAALDELKAELAGINTAVATKIAAGIAPVEEEIARMSAGLMAQEKRLRDVRRANLVTDPARKGIVQDGRYTGMDSLDLLMMQSAARSELQRDGIEPRQRAHVEQWLEHLKAALDSVTVGAGDELVPTNESSELWMDVNLLSAIAPLFRQFDMPTNPWDLPTQLGDVNFYPGVANIAGTPTDPTTAKATLTAFEEVGVLSLAYDLDEDSAIAIQPALREGLTRNMAEIVDDILLNADTTAANGINSDGATITTGDAGKGQWLHGFDGLRHLPLIDNTNQANDHNAAVSDDMFNEIRSKLGKYGVRPSEQAFITDVNTFIRSQSVTTLRTLDVLGPAATILTGQLGSVEGIPIIVSEKMKLTASDGKVTDGTAGTVGSLLIVNRSQWYTGFQRHQMIEVERDIIKRQHTMVASFRLAMTQRAASRATATHTALQYNITGVA
jgi:HK97 family phage major capsid protein